MAGWLESLESFGGNLLNAASEGLADRIKTELNPDAPHDPVNRPETQYDTQLQEPVDGPESNRPVGGAAESAAAVLGKYKWWLAGGLGVVAFLSWRR